MPDNPGSTFLKTKKTSGVYTKEIKSVKPTDAEYVGGKAAKFYLLRKHIPNNSPDPAIAITFKHAAVMKMRCDLHMS